MDLYGQAAVNRVSGGDCLATAGLFCRWQQRRLPQDSFASSDSRPLGTAGNGSDNELETILKALTHIRTVIFLIHSATTTCSTGSTRPRLSRQAPGWLCCSRVNSRLLCHGKESKFPPAGTTTCEWELLVSQVALDCCSCHIFMFLSLLLLRSLSMASLLDGCLALQEHLSNLSYSLVVTLSISLSHTHSQLTPLTMSQLAQRHRQSDDDRARE